MVLLSGTHPVTMDDKNRVSIPVPFRKGIPESMLVLTKGMINDCIWAFTPEKWEQVRAAVKNVQNLPLAKLDELKTRFLKPSSEVELDQYGRITIPQKLKDFAKLNKEIIITSDGDCIEIWDEKSYAEYEQKVNADLPGILEEVGNIPGL